MTQRRRRQTQKLSLLYTKQSTGPHNRWATMLLRNYMEDRKLQPLLADLAHYPIKQRTASYGSGDVEEEEGSGAGEERVDPRGNSIHLCFHNFQPEPRTVAVATTPLAIAVGSRM